jgi:SET domain-containing protein
MKTEIRPSNIEGVGLFSLTSIPKSVKIADYIGEEMTLKEFKERYGKYRDNCLNTYRMKRQKKIIVAK